MEDIRDKTEPNTRRQRANHNVKVLPWDDLIAEDKVNWDLVTKEVALEVYEDCLSSIVVSNAKFEEVLRNDESVFKGVKNNYLRDMTSVVSQHFRNYEAAVLETNRLPSRWSNEDDNETASATQNDLSHEDEKDGLLEAMLMAVMRKGAMELKNLVQVLRAEGLPRMYYVIYDKLSFRVPKAFENYYQ